MEYNKPVKMYSSTKSATSNHSSPLYINPTNRFHETNLDLTNFSQGSYTYFNEIHYSNNTTGNELSSSVISSTTAAMETNALFDYDSTNWTVSDYSNHGLEHRQEPSNKTLCTWPNNDQNECLKVNYGNDFVAKTMLTNNDSTKIKKRKSGKTNYKHIPHKEKPVHLVARRNARERKRVQAVNMAFVKLRKCVPVENRNKRLSKVKTLHRAIEYISALEKLLNEPDTFDDSKTSFDSGSVCLDSSIENLIDSADIHQTDNFHYDGNNASIGDKSRGPHCYASQQMMFSLFDSQTLANSIPISTSTINKENSHSFKDAPR